MLSLVELGGTEEATIELDGSIDAEGAGRLASDRRFHLALDPLGRVPVSLLFFAMRNLGLRGVPGPRFDYREALWRVEVMHAGSAHASWFAVRCDLDHPVVLRAGGLLVRYPVQSASFAFREDSREWSVDVESRPNGDSAPRRLHIRARSSGDVAEAIPPRPVFVRSSGRLYRILGMRNPRCSAGSPPSK